jgi:hypothetical protein
VADHLEAGEGGEWNFCHSTQYVMTCSMLSAIMASIPPARYTWQDGLRSAANLAGCDQPGT